MSETRSPGSLASTLLRIPVPWVFILVYLVGVALEIALRAGGWIPDRLGVTLVGAALFALGAVIAGWGWILFHRERTTRVPGEASTTLVTRGPYRYTRNPMYVGLSFAYLGEAGMLHQIVPVLLLPFVILYLNQVVIPVEEERLRGVFGSAYAQYQAEVRRWL